MSWWSWIFKKKSSQSAPVKTVPSDIENQIDLIVEKNISKFTNLLNFNSNVDFWKAVVKAVCSAESSFNVTETYYEDQLADRNGNDPVTGMRYLSEGLMQLSYSDAIVYHCEFDIEGDRNKSEHDKTKTIFDVSKNIVCGLSILDKMVLKHGDYIFNSGNYWSTLMPRNKRHQEFLNAFNKYSPKK